ARRTSTLRRRMQALSRCPAALALQNELFTLNRLILKKFAHPGRRHIDPAQRERLKRLQTIADAAAKLLADITDLEDALLLNVYESQPLPFPSNRLDRQLTDLSDGVEQFLLHLYSLDQSD